MASGETPPPSSHIRIWPIVVVAAGLGALASRFVSAEAARVESAVSLVCGIAMVIAGGSLLLQFRQPPATPEAQAIRRPLRTLALCQIAFGLAFMVPDLRVHVAALLIVLAPAVISIVQIRQALKAKPGSAP